MRQQAVTVPEGNSRVNDGRLDPIAPLRRAIVPFTTKSLILAFISRTPWAKSPPVLCFILCLVSMSSHNEQRTTAS